MPDIREMSRAAREIAAAGNPYFAEIAYRGSSLDPVSGWKVLSDLTFGKEKAELDRVYRHVANRITGGSNGHGSIRFVVAKEPKNQIPYKKKSGSKRVGHEETGTLTRRFKDEIFRKADSLKDAASAFREGYNAVKHPPKPSLLKRIFFGAQRDPIPGSTLEAINAGRKAALKSLKESGKF